VKANKITSFAALSERVLAEVEGEQRVKSAEIAAIREANPDSCSEIAQLLHKVASEIRSAPSDITYDDMANFMSGGAK
jgi:hypothetical protein